MTDVISRAIASCLISAERGMSSLLSSCGCTSPHTANGKYEWELDEDDADNFPLSLLSKFDIDSELDEWERGDQGTRYFFVCDYAYGLCHANGFSRDAHECYEHHSCQVCSECVVWVLRAKLLCRNGVQSNRQTQLSGGVRVNGY